MLPPHSRGGGCVGGFDSVAAAASMSKEDAAVDYSLIICVGSGERPR